MLAKSSKKVNEVFLDTCFVMEFQIHSTFFGIPLHTLICLRLSSW